MKKIDYPQIKESIYQEVLPNGLKVVLLPKSAYHKTYGIFTTNYGSIDNAFIPIDGTAPVTVPDGIAHFLEHKMFEKEDYDAFELFGKNGASSNAFTSFTRTSYLFSSTEHEQENIATLLDFVQDPYFSEKTVEKEKGIIGQEIQMYDDDPNWRLYFGLIGNLFPNHPVHIDIAGTVDSIAQITAEDLYRCYRTFYHPSNMTLYVVGHINPETTMTQIRANQAAKTFLPAKEIKRLLPELDATGADIIPYRAIEMAVNRSKSIVGVKGLTEIPETREGLAYRLKINLLLELLLGETSENYLRLYNEGILDDTFSFSFSAERSFSFADLGGDAENPHQLSEAIVDVLLSDKRDDQLTEEKLALMKKEMIGKFFQSLNSLEFIANQLSGENYQDANLFDSIDLIESITLDEIKAVANAFLKPEAISVFHILPKLEN